MHRVVEPGEMDVLIGSSSSDMRLKGTSSLGSEIREVGDLRADEATRQVLERHLPGVGTGRVVEMIKRMTVRQLGGMRWVAMQPAQLEAIGAELAAIAEEKSPR